MIYFLLFYLFFFVIALVTVAPYARAIGLFTCTWVILLCPILDVAALLADVPKRFANNLRKWARNLEAQRLINKYKRKTKEFGGLKVVD